MPDQEVLSLSWLVDGRLQTREVAIGQTVVIGRLPECEVVINDQKVSRRHAQITGRQEGGRDVFELKNLSQTNAIFFAKPANLPALESGRTMLITEGCDFLIGPVSIVARLPQPKSVQSTTPGFKTVKVRCANCRELVDSNLKDCPWCGTTLAFGGTFI